MRQYYWKHIESIGGDVEDTDIWERWCPHAGMLTGTCALTNNLAILSNLGVPGGSVSKESSCNAGDPGSIPGLKRSPGGGNGNPLQYSCLESPMDRGAWWATVYGVAKVKHDDDWAHNRYEAASHWGFDLHLPSDNNVENIFISILAICRFSLEKWPFKSSMHF